MKGWPHVQSRADRLLVCLVATALLAGCDSLAPREPIDPGSIGRPPSFGFPVFPDASVVSSCMRVAAGSRAAPVGTSAEVCNGWDDDCDGVIDEGFDQDRDAFSTCETANADPVDCDDSNPAIHAGVVDVCDGVDNDCDQKWDESLGPPCPAMPPRCSMRRTCPDDLVCVRPGEPCVKPAACTALMAVDTLCPAPAKMFDPSPCDPTQCGRWQSGTCWGECTCGDDGIFRWQVNCTE